MRNIVFLKVITILLLFTMSTEVYATTILSFPVKIVSKLKCKRQNFDTMGEDCKQKLPILRPEDYKKYRNNSTYRNYYSVLWWATYKDGWDPWKWSHLWVDIASAKWTPIYSIYDWKVVVAGYKYGRWNIVSIEHKINWKQVFSNYAHMSKILVKVWQKVKTWQQIWKMWSTGASTWNHVHFQIDITNKTRHPYRYAQCSWEKAVVNRGLCRDGLLSNTTDPLLFLETNWKILNNKIQKTTKNNNSSTKKINNNSSKKIINSKKIIKKKVKTKKVVEKETKKIIKK